MFSGSACLVAGLGSRGDKREEGGINPVVPPQLYELETVYPVRYPPLDPRDGGAFVTSTGARCPGCGFHIMPLRRSYVMARFADLYQGETFANYEPRQSDGKRARVRGTCVFRPLPLARRTPRNGVRRLNAALQRSRTLLSTANFSGPLS